MRVLALTLPGAMTVSIPVGLYLHPYQASIVSKSMDDSIFGPIAFLLVAVATFCSFAALDKCMTSRPTERYGIMVCLVLMVFNFLATAACGMGTVVLLMIFAHRFAT